MSRIHHDVPPFVKVDGADLVRGVNDVGLKRAGYTDDDVQALDDACRKLFYREKPMAVAMAEFCTQNGVNPQVKRMVEFLRQRDLGRHGRYQESARQK
jgi:UDP-N-acetylglucosamine acyltransferase